MMLKYRSSLGEMCSDVLPSFDIPGLSRNLSTLLFKLIPIDRRDDIDWDERTLPDFFA